MPKKDHFKVYPEEHVQKRQFTTSHTLPRSISTLAPRSNFSPQFSIMKRISMMNALMTGLVISLSYLENELFYANGFSSTIETDCLRTVIMLMCIGQAALVIRFYQSAMAIRVACRELHPSSKGNLGVLWEIPDLRNSCVIETALCLICIPPRVELNFRYEQLSNVLTLSLDDKMLFVSALKCYFIIKFFCIWSPYFGVRARFYL